MNFEGLELKVILNVGYVFHKQIFQLWTGNIQ